MPSLTSNLGRASGGQNSGADYASRPRAALRRAETKVVVHDLSEDGLLVESPIPLAQGEILEVVIPEAGIVQAEVAWSSSGRFFGCRFKEPDLHRRGQRCITEQPVAAAPVGQLRDRRKGLIELEALSFAIKRMTRVVDKAIDQLTKKRD